MWDLQILADESEDSCEFFDALKHPLPRVYPSSTSTRNRIYRRGCFVCFKMLKCGHNITDSSTDYCLNCGMNIEGGTNTNYKECKNCNSYYLASSKCFFCTRCGSEYPNMSGEITCTCGYINEEEANNCFNCGYPLVYRDMLELFKCPVHYRHPNTRYCYKCGVYLVPQDECRHIKILTWS